MASEHGVRAEEPRWKAALAASGQREPVRTKIEFSHRNGDARYLLEPVPGAVVAPYALRAPSVMHYTADAAVEQKIEALAGRSETQARGVFDLDMLLRRQPPVPIASDAPVREQAVAHALDLPYDAFRDQVLPFLDADVTELYADAGSWTQIQGHVVERLLEGA